jgi:ABC-type polar amino acid transport system ATPase subunit
MTDAMIEVTGLVKHHAGRRVLDGVDLAVRPGEVAAIIGPSGGGKSTLLRCINGLERFEAGAIRIESLRLGAAEVAEPESLVRLRRLVGMVFQQFNLFPHLNVLDNVTIAPRLALREPADRAAATARDLLKRVGLGDKLASKPGQLSGGEQQRVAIARALAVRPRAILFDEPTSALDPRMSAEVLSVITDLAQGGLTMIVVTHAMSFARRVAHRVHVMAAGRVAESGPADQIFTAPRTDVTRQFLLQLDATDR